MGNQSSVQSPTDMIVPRSFMMPRRSRIGNSASQSANSHTKPSKNKQMAYDPSVSNSQSSPHKVAYGTSTYASRPIQIPPYTSNPAPQSTLSQTITQPPGAKSSMANNLSGGTGNQMAPPVRPIPLTRSLPDSSQPLLPSLSFHQSSADTYRRRSQKYVALHDYTARVEDDLSMLKGQHFYIIDRSQGYWWYVKCGVTGKVGYVPFNYLAPVTSLESNEWHFGDMRRLEAENCLMMPGNGHGSFLVRVSESRSGAFSLSVRDGDVVKHYRIRSRPSRTNPEIHRFFISRQLPFSSVQSLVEHYTKNQSGLCCQLTSPCIKPSQPVPVGLSHNTVDKWEIPKSSIVLKERIGKGQFGEVYRAVWNDTTLVAVKTLRASK
ncbi:unnamed protein product [Rodentolepis nana]|uniref:Tyrosine-protein kinase n=1 Tax=Rodentolepis nana TaxID=102285 RepID=A0A158QIJ8_RODNA|nr:unnamed protein product [Rodentolepis nana]